MLRDFRDLAHAPREPWFYYIFEIRCDIYAVRFLMLKSSRPYPESIQMYISLET